MSDGFYTTLWKRNDSYLEVLLSDGLGGEARYLPEEIVLDEMGKFDTFTVGKKAVDLYLVKDAGPEDQIFNSGIPFYGSIIGAKMDMTAEELRQHNVHLEIARHLAELFNEDNETPQTAVA